MGRVRVYECNGGSYHSVFLVPSVPFLCSIRSLFLVPVCWFVSLFIDWLLYRIVCLWLFSVSSEYLQIFLGTSDTVSYPIP